MGMFSWIKEKLFGKKQNLLEEGKNNNSIQTKSPSIPNTLDEYRLQGTPTISPKSYAPSIDTPEGAIDQYLSALLYKRLNNENINSYGVLTSIGGIDDRTTPRKKS